MRKFVLAVVMLSAVGVAAASADEEKERIDPRADQLMHRMSTFLTEQSSFTVRPESSIEFVDEGQKLELQSTSDLKLKRPDKLKVDRAGPSLPT